MYAAKKNAPAENGTPKGLKIQTPSVSMIPISAHCPCAPSSVSNGFMNANRIHPIRMIPLPRLVSFVFIYLIFTFLVFDHAP